MENLTIDQELQDEQEARELHRMVSDLGCISQDELEELKLIEA